MPKIGILYGMENSFPNALVERINSKQSSGMVADHIRVGGVKAAETCPYAVIVDRVSQDVDFYRAFLKNAVLGGAWVLNNPFRWTAQDKFMHVGVAQQLGLHVPATVVIPQKAHPPGTGVQSMRNLSYPLDWDELFAHVKFPAFLKPVRRGGWMSVERVNSPDEFFAAYDQTGPVCMLLQAAVPFQSFFRSFVVGSDVRVLRYDPQQPQHLRYGPDDGTPDKVCEEIAHGAITLCQAIGCDINAVDFAIADNVPFVIDSFNPAFDADVRSVGQANFEWLVDQVAAIAIERAAHPEGAAGQLAPLRISGTRVVAAS